jgi:CheY-like chemotaxis protein
MNRVEGFHGAFGRNVQGSAGCPARNGCVFFQTHRLLDIPRVKELIKAYCLEEKERGRFCSRWLAAEFFQGDLPVDFGPCGRISADQMLNEVGTMIKSNSAVLNVLIVDDNEDHRLIFSAYLERDGHKVTLADNGPDALALCRLNRYDVIIMDLRIPEMDGYEITRRIRLMEEKSQKQRSLILAVSADALVEHRKMALEAGCDGYYSKPLRREDLMRILTCLIEKDADPSCARLA